MKTHWYLPIGLTLVSAALIAFLKPGPGKTLPVQKEVLHSKHPQAGKYFKDKDSISTPSKPRKKIPLAEAFKYAKPVAKSNNRFAAKLAKLYIRSKEQKHKNIFFSPFSISSALSMTGEGARGETQKQILDVFHLSASDSARKYGVLGLFKLLNDPKSSYKLNTSNSLWIQEGEKLNVDFLESSRDFYRANVEFVNFGNAQKASKTINQFVEKKTENRIKNLIAPGLITADTRLILTNTIYFKSDWKKQFEPEDTDQRDFTTGNGNSVTVDMMYQKSHFNYFENESFQALEMEYKDGDMSMIVILPQSEDANSIAEIDLDQAISISADQYINQKVEVSFPKFRFETSYSLKQDLSKLGMPLAFENADFSGISNESRLKIAEVIHKAFVEVGEKGTEAAAATAVLMEIESINHNFEDRPKIFRADHPFVFMIRHNQSGTILFMGVVNNPVKN